MLSVQPGAFKKTGSRPSSAMGRASAFAPSTNVGASASTSAAAKVESDLVSNLKEQINCLEMEVTYLKEKNAQLAAQPVPAAQQPASPAVAESGDFRTTHADLLNHAGRLEKEVADLRQRFAERERQHQLDLAHVRAGAEPGGRDTYTTAVVSTNLKQELYLCKETHAKDLAQLKDVHAQAVITLQKTVERVNIEHQAIHNELLATVKERDALLRDMSGHKEEIRTLRSSNETTGRQYDETQRLLRAEQEERRRLENREKDLKFQVGQGHEQLVASLEKKVSELEERAKKASADCVLKAYEVEQLTVANKQLQSDMVLMVTSKGVTLEETNQLKTQIADLTANVAKSMATVADVSSERDYFRLQIDRLKVDHSVLDVKATQLEAKGDGDKTAYLNLERQYCTALETIDQLKRESKTKERVYEQLDGNDTKLRQANLVLTNELQTLRHNTDELKNALGEISSKYEQNKDLADQARTEQHLAMTLTKLDKMKGELQGLLGTQLRLTHDLSASMMELPDSSAVMKAMSPAPTRAGAATTNKVSASDINADISAILAGPNTAASPSSVVVTQTPTSEV